MGEKYADFKKSYTVFIVYLVLRIKDKDIFIQISILGHTLIVSFELVSNYLGIMSVLNMLR